ncbi:MAG: exodeoxyribonuclease VII large subunit [Pseudomonadota bacterium]|nr:exodeoxyribonuclease VII large subunit [Pseudomonadota bacterium]
MTDPNFQIIENTGSEHNISELSVGDVARAIKRTLETEFGRLRIRGEISRPNYHGSGHLYFTLKDQEAVIDSVCWRGTVEKLSLTLEEGMEVVCTGRISSYARSSKYQIVIEAVELAGEGALLRLLEERRKKLTEEGLFSDKKKKKLPFLPETIGVVTSPSGAVIRDILHRLTARFPQRVLLWPVLVQGEGAAQEIARAINGFNSLFDEENTPRPDLIIVARGGGSLEDLWCFNEESVVRAVAGSEIPVISGVGHETDVTLIDFAADVRAPTPTAAAEMAVPVRAELTAQVLDLVTRSVSAIERLQQSFQLQVDASSRGLTKPEFFISEAQQSLDVCSDRLSLIISIFFQKLGDRIEAVSAKILHPREFLNALDERLLRFREKLESDAQIVLDARYQKLRGLDYTIRSSTAVQRLLQTWKNIVASNGKLLVSYSYKDVLKRGFTLIRASNGCPIKLSKTVKTGEKISIEFFDGVKEASVIGDETRNIKTNGGHRRKKKKRQSDQGTLL